MQWFAVRKLSVLLRRMRRAFLQPNIDAFRSKKPLRLHLGCGQVYLDGWVNIDASEQSVADITMNFHDVGRAFLPGTVDDVVMIHSVSYLRLWEAMEVLQSIYELLKPGGSFIAEFPDILKCAWAITRAANEQEYLEAVRGIYAFSMEDIARRVPYVPYGFGWSADYLRKELMKLGFSSVRLLEPQTHGQRKWRDSRIEATK